MSTGNARLQPGSLNAGQQPGAPRWHSRGYLPHFESANAIQDMTYRLAGSLPADVLARLGYELRTVPQGQRDIERRKRTEAWMDVGHGCCILRNPVVAETVHASFLHFDGERYRLFAWVVMPNHVHVLFQTLVGWAMATIVASWKSFTGRRIAAYLDQVGWGARAGGWRSRGERQVWQRESGTGLCATNNIFGQRRPTFMTTR